METNNGMIKRQRYWAFNQPNTPEEDPEKIPNTNDTFIFLKQS